MSFRQFLWLNCWSPWWLTHLRLFLPTSDKKKTVPSHLKSQPYASVARVSEVGMSMCCITLNEQDPIRLHQANAVKRYVLHHFRSCAKTSGSIVGAMLCCKVMIEKLKFLWSNRERVTVQHYKCLFVCLFAWFSWAYFTAGSASGLSGTL